MDCVFVLGMILLSPLHLNDRHPQISPHYCLAKNLLLESKLIAIIMWFKIIHSEVVLYNECSHVIQYMIKDFVTFSHKCNPT